jgi:hypothetical protein
MKMQLTFRTLRSFAIPLIAFLAICAPVGAKAGSGAGGHGGGGGHAGGFHGGFGGHGGFGNPHGGYGYRGGWHGGYSYRGGYGLGGWGWPGYGLFFSTLPLYYSTLWWDGVPYYYANDNYYQWNGSVAQYESVAPPQEVVNQVASVSDLFAYPMNQQTVEQQRQDKRECSNWAAIQSGVEAQTSDLAATTVATDGNESATKRQAYLRAETACFEARGYSVR